MRRLALNITSDTVHHIDWAYSGILVMCAKCRHRCRDVTPFGRRVYEPFVFRCGRCRIDWLVEDTSDYRFPI